MKSNIIWTASKVFCYFSQITTFIMSLKSLGQPEGIAYASIFGVSVAAGYALHGWKQYNDRKKQN